MSIDVRIYCIYTQKVSNNYLPTYVTIVTTRIEYINAMLYKRNLKYNKIHVGK